jgi:hypothetical protein
MLATIYLLLMTLFGDRICRHFFRYRSVSHRLATAFLVGLMFSSGVTYLSTLAFAGTGDPLVYGNLVFLVIAVAVIYFMPGRLRSDYLDTSAGRPPGDWRWDAVWFSILAVASVVLMFWTLGYKDGSFVFGFKSWSDFGANISLAQSLAIGDNYPTDHPFFPGVAVKYHFLFWFQCANFSFLGMNLAWAINILSVFSMMALIVLVITFVEVMFRSRIAARIAAVLFFFPTSSLSYWLFLKEQNSVWEALSRLYELRSFFNSGYPFRGEDWGSMAISVFSNQRHLISGVGILFIVAIFLVDLYLHKLAKAKAEAESEAAAKRSEEPAALGAAEAESEADAALEGEGNDNDLAVVTTDGQESDEITGETSDQPDEDDAVDIQTPPPAPVGPKPPIWTHFKLPFDFSRDIRSVIFAGILIGSLPYWNSAMFVCSLFVLGGMFLFLPYRIYTLTATIVAVAVGYPQVVLLRGAVEQASHSLFTWGYVLKDPTYPLILEYLGWTFGFKWLLLVIAMYFATGFQRRFLIAVTVLLPAVFFLQLSTDAFNNHKLLNTWNTFAVIFTAYALWEIGRGAVWRKVIAVVLALLMSFGAIGDFFVIKNDSPITVRHGNDRLTTWVLENTQTSDIFLSQNWLTHPVLFAGRRIYFGNSLFAWTAGYSLAERERTYRLMFMERDPVRLRTLLRENEIAYVAIDDGVRNNNVLGGANEAVYRQNFEPVFEDTERKYDNLIIFRVPSDGAAQ